MVSLASRKRACAHLLDRGYSRLRSCRVTRLSPFASRSKPKEPNPELRDKVLQLARANPRYGFRRVHALLPGVNLKAVHRIWKAEGLRLTRKVRKRLKVARSEPVKLTKANQSWCMDFTCWRLESGRMARIFVVLDVFTRECLLLKASPSFPAYAVEKELQWLFLVHGKPARLVSDNGPEFRAAELPVERAFDRSPFCDQSKVVGFPRQ